MRTKSVAASAPAPVTRASLLEQIRAIEDRARRHTQGVRVGWREIDGALGEGGLARGATHEWFGLANPACTRWLPPLLVLGHVVRQAAGDASRASWVVWVGRKVWPSAHGVMHDEHGHSRRLCRHVFVDPQSVADRVWAIDVALRVPGIVVVGDATGFTMPATRRLQLAAEAGGALGLFARPMQERDELSAAATRWEVAAEPSPTARARWRVRLCRCKGHAAKETQVVVERGDGGAIVPVLADVRDRSGGAAVAS